MSAELSGCAVFVVFVVVCSFPLSQGATLVSGSLDALETLGRKTVNVITEGDPGWFSHSNNRWVMRRKERVWAFQFLRCLQESHTLLA